MQAIEYIFKILDENPNKVFKPTDIVQIVTAQTGITTSNVYRALQNIESYNEYKVFIITNNNAGPSRTVKLYVNLK